MDLKTENKYLDKLTKEERARIANEVTWFMKMNCDLGMPIISVIDNESTPRDLCIHTGIAPFAPLRADTFSYAMELFSKAIKDGISCGWYTYSREIEVTDVNISTFWKLIRQLKLNVIFMGGAPSAFFEETICKLSPLGNKLLLFKEGVSHETLKSIPCNVKIFTKQDFECEYKKTLSSKTKISFWKIVDLVIRVTKF